MATSARSYAGRSAVDRRDERRERWLAAGLQLFGTVGLRGTSLRALARESGVAERYFAESFSGLEDLLAAVHDRVHAEMAAEVLAATTTAGDGLDDRVDAGLRAMVDALERDPRAARVKLVESIGAGPLVEAHRQAALREIADFLVASPGARVARPGLREDVLALATVGGIFELMTARHAGALDLTRDELLAHARALLTALLHPSD